MCQHVVWHDVTHTKTRFEGLKLLDFSLLQQAFDSTLLKNHVNFKIKPKLLKMPQIKIKLIILWSKNTPDFLPNIRDQYSHTEVGQFYCIFCKINKVKTSIFVFPHFGNIWFFKFRHIFVEYISLEGFSRQIIRIFDFLAWPAILHIYSHGLLHIRYDLP